MSIVGELLLLLIIVVIVLDQFKKKRGKDERLRKFI